MKALLGNLRLKKALEEEKKLPESSSAEQKQELSKQIKEIDEKSYNTLILSFGDKVLGEVSKITIALFLWNRLETLYLTKTLSTRLFLKTRFFSFRMGEGQKLQDHIDDFTKLCLDLENIDIKYDDENKALVLLHSLPRSHETFVDILKHGREKLFSG